MFQHIMKKMVCCLTWIQDLWNNQQFCEADIHGKGNSFSSLPDDILVNILSRLPAETVVSCKLSCSRLLNLYTKSQFAEIHLTRATPITMVQDIGLRTTSASDKISMFTIENIGTNKGLRKVCMKNMQRVLHKNRLQLLASCDGLLLFEDFMSVQNIVVCNPITQEAAAMRIRGKLCGFFFHQSTREYKVLLWHRSASNTIQYYVQSLKTKERRSLVSSSYFPQHIDGPATILHGSLLFFVVLYRSKHGYDIPKCSKSITMFNLDTEVFHVMPHPGAKCSSFGFMSMHYEMQLLEMNGSLFFSNLRANEVEVWILEDTLNWVWVKIYVVNLDRLVNPYGCFRSRPTYFSLVKVCDIQNGELLLDIPFRGLFWCNPRLKTVRRIKTGYQSMRGYGNFIAVKYTKSLISLQQVL